MEKIVKIRTFVILIFTSIVLSSCGLPVRLTDVRGSGNIVTESRMVAGFRTVEISGIGKLFIEQGEKESLEITAEDNLIKHLKSQVSGSRLQLGSEEFVNIHPTKDIVYKLTVKDLNQIEASGLGNIESKKLETENLTILISGGARVSIDDLQATTLSLEISGLGEVSADGKVQEQHIDISGAGSYNAPNLASQTASVVISGSGTAIIWVSDRLDLELSGLGRVHYYGSPVLNTEITGSGVLKNLGNK
jgi:hypothetical protein